MLSRAVVLAVVASVAASVAAASPAGPRLLTIAVSRTPIDGLAQDGTTVAWRTSCDGARVSVQTVRGGRESVFGQCGLGTSDRRFFALAGGRALWTTESVGNGTWSYPATAAPGHRPRTLAELEYDNAVLVGTHLGGAAGDGSTLVYSTVEVGVDPATCDSEGFGCTPIVSGGRVWRVLRGRAVASPVASPAFLLAASARRIALVVAFASSGERLARLGPGRAVELRDVATGRRPPGSSATAQCVHSHSLRPTPRCSSPATVVGVSSAGRSTGAASRRRPCLRTPPTSSAPSGSAGVFRVGRSIRVLDVRSGTVRLVATARSLPVGLSIESNRVMWAEHFRGRSRVRALWL
jgi:hypothetical protein